MKTKIYITGCSGFIGFHSALSDTKLLKNLKNYIPKISYKLGVKKFISWYKNYYQ